MKNKKYHTVGTGPKTNRKIVEIGKIDNSSKHKHDCSLSWLGIGTSMKSGGFILVLKCSTNIILELVTTVDVAVLCFSTSFCIVPDAIIWTCDVFYFIPFKILNIFRSSTFSFKILSFPLIADVSS